MTTPADLLTRLNREDSAAPRITCYDDLPGPTVGERIELSGRVIDTWVSKAANALQDEWGLQPGETVRLALRPHWRLLYWAWATWSVGATVELGDGGGASPDLVVTDDLDRLVAGVPGVFVTRGALARSAGVELPGSTMDEAAELASHGDDFTALDEPDEDDTALLVAGERLAYGEVVPALTGAGVEQDSRLQLVDPSAETLLRTAVAVWAAGGSLVVHLGPSDPATVERRAQAEGVTQG